MEGESYSKERNSVEVKDKKANSKDENRKELNAKETKRKRKVLNYNECNSFMERDEIE